MFACSFAFCGCGAFFEGRRDGDDGQNVFNHGATANANAICGHQLHRIMLVLAYMLA